MQEQGRKSNTEDLDVILYRISNTFSKYESGLAPSGESVEERGRAESDFDEY